MIRMCMRLFCVCVVLCVGSGLATGCHSSKESYRLWKMITELNRGQGPEWAGKAIKTKKVIS
jgi:hypothetical protein